MKYAIVALMLAVGSTSWAVEYPGNPDKVPSVGFNFGGIAESGDVTVTDSPNSAKQTIEMTNAHLILDVRVPVSNNVTLNGALGLSGSTSQANETPMLLGQKSESSGLSFNVGVRFYLQ